MITEQGLKRGVATMGLMKFFPADPETRGALMELLNEMCHSDDEIIWLAKRMRNLFSEWPGPQELRAVLCGKVRPRDGVECYSEIYPDGIPSEKESQPLQLEAKAPIALPAGHNASVDPELENTVTQLAEALSMPRMPKYHARTPDEIRVDAELRQLFRMGDGEVK